MNEYPYILTAELFGWDNLLSPLVGWDYPIFGVRVNILQESSRIGIVDEPVGFCLGSELLLPLVSLLDYDTWPYVGLQMIVYIPPR